MSLHTLVTGWWFSPGTPVSSTNKIGSHDITEIFLSKVALNTIKQTKHMQYMFIMLHNISVHQSEN